MKRCPQCEFLYEDEQSLCDMDGALLVLDSRKLPNLHALATVPAVVAVQPRRSRAVPAFATVVLALVLGMVYYVSTQRHTSSPMPAVSTSSDVQPVSNPASMTDPAPPAQASESPKESESPKVEQTQPAVKQQPPVAPVKKPAAKTVVAPQTVKPATEPKKEDSKVGSILKKTGRILKKPFKF